MPEAPLILCVDDNEGARYALVRTLQRAGFRTLEAATGLGALAEAQKQPDLIVLDVQLPDISGYEVCQRIKGDPLTAATPVLQISADFIDVDHRTRGLELGADAYLAHPIEPPELIATIRSLLRARKAEEEARRIARELSSTFDAVADPISLLDRDGRVVRCNQAMARFQDAPMEALHGRGLETFLPAAAAGAEEDPFRRMVQTRSRAELEIQHGARWLRVTCDPVLDERGQLTGAVCVFLDFTERRRAQEEREQLLAREQTARAEAQAALRALEASESRFQRLADSNVIGVVEADLRGQVRWANNAALEMLGRTRVELSAGLVRLDTATPPEWLHADDRATGQLLAEGVSEPYHKELRRPDGTKVPTYVGTALFGEERQVAFLVDLTLVRRLETELREKVAQLETADQRKDEFLAMLAHELRNPLAAVTVALHALDKGPDPLRSRGVIQRQLKVLTRLVDDLLDVSRITRGKVELRMEAVRAREVLENALSTARPIVESRRHALKAVVDEDPLPLRGDATRLEQVFTNLLNNAAKYTEPGGSIEVRLAREEDHAVLRVKDSGIGIAPENVERVFDLFAQVDQSPARTAGGLGVGLTLVKRLVEMHGGEVRAQSAGLGQGSEFEVRLPLAKDAQPRARSQPPRVERGPRRILLVEDNPDIGETLRDLLQLFGHEVALASNGLRGVQLAVTWQPEVALVDIGLPGIDGYEVARRLRATDAGRRMLIIALTGYGRPEDRRQAHEAGFDAHLVKPVDPEELVRLVTELHAERSAQAS